MPISFEAALGIHDRALAIRSQRAEVLANNIVNADTPGFKARDINFREMLASVQGSSASSPDRTHARHLGGAAMSPAAELMYRNSYQPSIDGNTVDLQIEQAEYAKNALGFQASFTFLNSKINGLRAAIKGE